MAKIQTPFNPEIPIPNNPFYTPETNALQSIAGPLIVGAGFTINYATGVISSSGGGGGGLTSVTAGTGLTANGVPGGVITTTGTLALEDTAVAAGSYTRANITINAQGRITAATSGTGGGTVTSVGTGTGLTGGPITASGTVSLANTAVTAGSYTLGSFTVDAQGRLTIASSGSAVTSVTAGAGLSGGVITSSGTVSLPDTGVAAATYSNPTLTIDLKGRITSAISGTASVSAVTATAPVVSSGGTSPVISLQNSGVTPNVYTNASITVNGFGIITAANSGLAPVTSISVIGPLAKSGTTTPVLSIGSASTGQPGVVQVGTNIQVNGLGVISVDSASTSLSGIVQLNNTVTSTSVTEALTANQGKLLQDQITSLVASGSIELAGTIDASTGLVVSVTSVGTADGYTIGSVLPAASATTNNSYVITTEPGTLTPPGGSPTVATRGDWFLVSELTPGNYSWTFLNVGIDVSAASTGTAGIVQLATVVQTQAGTDNSLAVTPLSAAGTYIPLTALTGKGAILGASAANTPSALPVGADGEYLVADSSQSTGLAWGALSQDFIPEATFTAAGELISGTGSGTYVALAVGANGEFLVADSTCVGGLKWFTPDYLEPSLFTATGSLLTATGAGVVSELALGTNGQVLTVCTIAPNGLCWAAASVPAISCSTLVSKGDLITTASPDTPVALPVGADGDVLTACSTAAEGLCWVAPVAAIPCACLTAKGDLIVAASANTPTALPVGVDGQFLVVNSTCPEGMAWQTGGGIPCACITGKGAIVTGNAANAPIGLPAGSNGQILMANSVNSIGIQWQTGAIGGWTNAGTLQSVGWTSTGGVPVVPGSTNYNSVSYRQLGPKEWEVRYSLEITSNFVNSGNGDYIFSLPAGLQFDTSLIWQQTFTANVGVSSNYNAIFILPNSSANVAFYVSPGNRTVYGAGPATWSANQFRLFTTDNTQIPSAAPGAGAWSGMRAMSSVYYGGTNSLAFRIGFQFTST